MPISTSWQRVVDADVQAVYATERDTQSSIMTAHVLIDTYYLTAGLPESLLQQLELYLAAHLACLSDTAGGRETEVELADVRIRMEREKPGLGLDRTPFGHLLMLLDPSGILAGLGVKRATFDVV